MRNDPLHAWRRAAIPLVVTMMMIQSGCLSGPAPPDRFYRLEIPDAAARLELPRLPGRLLVDSVRGDAMTRERRMLYRNASDPSQVKREAYDSWVDPPPLMVQRAVVAFFRSANAAEVVITPEMRLDADFRLGGRVDRFERLVGQGSSRATIELEFTLVRVEDRKPLLLETYREHEDVAGSGAGDSVEAFSRALHRILERLVLDLPEEQ
jgi:ABC-type uncharacterized transport system auxiliary subunit